MDKFEYMTWSFAEGLGNGAVVYVNGQLEDPQVPMPQALARAASAGWRLAFAYSPEPGRTTFIFERPAAA